MSLLKKKKKSGFNGGVGIPHLLFHNFTLMGSDLASDLGTLLGYVFFRFLIWKVELTPLVNFLMIEFSGEKNNVCRRCICHTFAWHRLFSF